MRACVHVRACICVWDMHVCDCQHFPSIQGAAAMPSTATLPPQGQFEHPTVPTSASLLGDVDPLQPTMGGRSKSSFDRIVEKLAPDYPHYLRYVQHLKTFFLFLSSCLLYLVLYSVAYPLLSFSFFYYSLYSYPSSPLHLCPHLLLSPFSLGPCFPLSFLFSLLFSLFSSLLSPLFLFLLLLPPFHQG